MIGEVHLLHKAAPSSLREMVVLSDAQKPTLRVKENKETGMCSKWKNMIKSQKKTEWNADVWFTWWSVQNNGPKDAHKVKKTKSKNFYKKKM